MIRLYLLLFTFLSLHSAAQEEINSIQEFYAQAEEASGDVPLTLSFVQPSMHLVENYENLEQIMVVRHGEPALNKKGWRTRKEAEQFIRAYDSVGVEPLSFQPVKLKKDEIETVYTSTLPRAKHTARRIFGNQVRYVESPIYKEFERKIMGFFNMKLPLKFWLVNSRILWLLGGNDKNIESFKLAKRRALKAAMQLEDEAEKKGKVVLVAHGFLNRYVIKNLEKRGWTLVRDGKRDYLAVSLLVRMKSQQDD